jgi:large subunit ribosomal protein L2|tara:strand:- start:26 stop:814 length:789 start_codon:yes stop_codon:yes gene_type:complete
MILVKNKPTTNGLRHQVNIKKSLLSKTNKIFKNSIFGHKQSGGRSATTGRITVWHKGKGCKSNFRKIQFTNAKFDSIVVCVMYDPKRNSFVSLNFDLSTLSFFLTLSTNYVYSGSLVSCNSQKTEFSLGNRTIIDNIPAGTLIHSLTSSSNNNKTIFSRSAGTYCQLIQKSISECKVRLPSGLIITVPSDSYATLGVISNFNHKFTVLGKAGRNRLKGIRPTVRGVAMNPVDHPHGGRTNGGRPSVTPWGIPTKGKPTVKKK